MTPFNDLRRLATADQAVRRTELLALLGEMDCPFLLLREPLLDLRPENIVIRFQEEAPQRFVIGAHYDSVTGSTGANDNGAGVCALLAWLRSALRHPPLSRSMSSSLILKSLDRSEAVPISSVLPLKTSWL